MASGCILSFTYLNSVVSVVAFVLCGNMVLPGAAEFCTVLFTVIFTNNGVHGEKLQLFCLQQAFWEHLLTAMKQMEKFHHHWFGDVYVWIICSSL